MFSRAHLLIQRDFERLTATRPWGIEAKPLKEDSLFEWSAKVLGLLGTPWEGGIFRLYVKFDEYYNDRPPEVCFHTIPFHPNVDMITGRPCIDFLDDHEQWKNFSLMCVLQTVQALLSNPVLEAAVNMQAVTLLLNTPNAYKQMTNDCVLASQRVEAGLAPHIEMKNQEDIKENFHNIQAPATTPKTNNKKKACISFEDYHSTWAGIATSKSNTDVANPLMDILEEHPGLVAAHYGVSQETLQMQIDKQIQEHNNLMYGRMNKNNVNEEEQRRAKLDKVNKMRKIYLQPRSPVKKSADPSSRPITQPVDRQVLEPWEAEVDDLVAWTNKLDMDQF